MVIFHSYVSLPEGISWFLRKVVLLDMWTTFQIGESSEDPLEVAQKSRGRISVNSPFLHGSNHTTV